MFEILKTEIYQKWFDKLKDKKAKALIDIRLARLEKGNMGDVSPVGEGVSELRIHFGAGYRIYLIKEGETIIILLSGGDKSTQQSDIVRAKQIAKELRK
ncbi:MAG: type II toxin-antitoxin system RelE/ParE family toxin [Candidatus Riflebacteria bacterium]|nr:type II toxin-antitoxin system RelE/ParE family toxin [Candidatus Riflebacteria bacterium]